MAAKGKRGLDFTINLGFVTKANSEIDGYINKLTQLKSQFGERLSGGFLDDTIKKLQSGQKAMADFSKVVNNPKLSKQERLGSLGSTAEELKGLTRMMKNLDKIWMNDAIKNNDKVLQQLEEIRSKQKSLSSIKGNITKNQNAMNQAENDLRATGYVGGTTANDARGLQVKLNKNKKALDGNFDNKDLIEENKLLEKQIALIDKIVKGRKKGAEYNKQVAAISAIDGKAGVTDVDAAGKRLGNKESVLLAQSDDAETIAKLNEELVKITPNVDEATRAVMNFDANGREAWDAAQLEIRQTEEATQTLKQVLAQFGIGISAVQIVNYFKELASAAFDFYKSLDEALNQIYVVSGLTSEAVLGLKDDFIRMSKDSGMAIDDITQSAVLFYQQGLDTGAVMEMTEVTAQFAKVAGIDATDAADKLTAAVNGYCLEAEDAAMVADKFNQVAAASAADIDELSTAFSKAAAQANQAGVGMDNYLAYIATMVEATREAPENIGTSLKTIMSRMQQVKMSGSTDDGETDVNQVETALKSVGVALRDTNNELRDLEEVFAELGPKWQSLDRNTQAYIGTIVAGTRQQSRFITLMQNWDRVLELSEESQNSAGMQSLMHAKAMDSLNSSVQQLHNAWETFISNLTESETLRGVVDLFTKLLNVVNKGNSPMKILAVSVALMSKNLTKFNGVLGKGLKGINKYVKTIKNMGKGIKNINKIEKTWTKSQKKQAKEYLNLKKRADGYTDRINALKKQQSACNMETKEGQEEFNSLGQKINEAEQGYSDITQQMSNMEGKLEGGVTQLREYDSAQDDVNNGLISMGAGLMAAGALMPGMLGNIASMTGGVLLLAGNIGKIKTEAQKAGLSWTVFTATFTAQTAAGTSFFAAAWKAACEVVKQALASTGLLGFLQIASAVISIVMSLVTILQSAGSFLVNLGFGDQSEKLAESIGNVTNALEAYNDQVTQLNAANKLMKTYEDLSRRMYLTSEEQEKLNETVSGLADAFDLETVEDAYGNVKISVTELTNAMEELEAKTKEARDELIKTEQEEAEKFDGTRKRRKMFYNEYLSKNKTTITGGMADIDYDIDTDELKADAATINELTATLQSGIVDYTNSISASFKDNLSVTEYIDRMMGSINDAVDDASWNNLFGELTYLQDEIDNLTYSEVSAKLDAFFENWAKDLGLTEQEIQAVRAAIEGTLYAGSNLDDTIRSYQDMLDKSDGSYYADQIKSQREEMEKYYDIMDHNGEWDGWNPFYKSDDEKAYEQAKRELEELEKQQEEAYDSLSEAEKEKYTAMIETLGSLTDATAAAMDQANLFSDIVNKDGETIMAAEQVLSNMDLTGINSAFKQSDNKGVEKLIQELQKQISDADDTELKLALQEKLDKVVNSLTLTPHISWGNLHDSLDKASEDLRSMNSIMSEFEENGGIALDTFADLCDILDGIDLAAVFDAGMMDEYLTALDQLNLGFDASTGYITAEGEAMQTLQDIQEIATKAEIQSQINKLEVRKASLQSQLAMIEAEMATNEALITYLAKAGDVEIELDTLKTMANAQYAQNMGTASEKITGYYTTLTSNSSQWATASIENAAKVGDAFNKLASGELNSATAQQYLNSLMKNVSFEGIDKSGLDGLANGGDTVKASAALGALQEYQSQLSNTYADITAQIKTIDGQITFLTKLKEMDLGKLGAEGKGDSKEIDKYIGKLMEIYNILNKIETAEHRLSTLETYASSATGKTYANNLQERIKLSKQLMGNYDALIKSQKDLVASEQKAIKDSPVGDVFSFDKYGTIQIDYEKYLALQDESIDGEMTLKELADNLYDEYQELYETQQDYFDRKIEYLEQVIELEQEQVDAYVELEHELADAVKDIYQEMLDEKLDAIDKEMEALDELQAAYEEANQARDDSREISKMQTDLRRSMMDTSGASNTKQLSYQDQIRQKLEDMGEDEYTKRLDDIRTALEDQQEMLQEQFDKFFEDYEELYKMIEERILGSESAVNEVLQTTSEWKEAAPAERQQMLTAWNTRYETAMSGLTGGATIMDVVTDIELLQGSIDELDRTMQQNGDPSRIGKEISTALTEYYLSKEGGGSGDGGDSSFKAGGGGVSVSGSPSTPKLDEYDTTLDLTNLDNASSKMDEIKEKIGSWWDKVKEFFSNVGSTLGNFFTSTLPTWWTEKVWNPVSNFFTQSIPNFFSGIGQTISTWWQENIAPKLSLEYWVSQGAQLLGAIDGTLLALKDKFLNWWNQNMAKFFTLEFWQEKISNIGKAIGEFFTVTIPEKWGLVTEWWSTNVAPIFTTEYWKEKFNSFVDGFKEKINEIGNWWSETAYPWIQDNIFAIFTKEYWVEKMNNIKNAVSEWWGGIKNWWNSTVVTWWNANVAKFFTAEYWSQKWETIKNGFVNGIKNALNGVIDKFNSFGQKLGGWVRSITNWVGEKFNAISNWWSNLTGKAKEDYNSSKNAAYNETMAKFKQGGMADFTGPAWLDGTKSEPEAVLNAAQTKSFMRIADNLDKLEGVTNIAGGNAAVNIENISFQVESMSSPEDGEAAFDAFITKFKEIGSQSGLNVWQTRKA